jgi:hypothetical protein
MIAFATICIVVVASSSITHEVVLANGPLTPAVQIYLPYISKQVPSTPTPTTPSPMPTGVYVLPNHSSYVSNNYLHIVGEVQNNTSSHLDFVKISAIIFDDSGRLIDTDSTYTYLDNLPAGDKTCFHILLEKPASWAYYQFEVPSYRTEGKPLPNLAVVNDSGSYDPTFGWYKIIGQVRNDHHTRIEYVQPVGTLYKASGVVIGCDFTFVNSTHLDPDQISAFKITFYGRDYADVASYRLQVDGNPLSP